MRVLDLESLGQHVGDSTLEAVLASRDAPSADAALPGDNDDSRAKSEKAVGEKAVAAGGSQPALVVARRVLAAACVREEVNSLQEKLVLVGDRQEWAKGRLAREEARRLAKEQRAAEKEAAKDEKRAADAEAKARTRSAGPGDVDAANDEDDEGPDEDGSDGADVRVRRARIPSLKATRSAVTWTRTTGAAAEKRTSGPSTATATVMTATRTTS